VPKVPGDPVLFIHSSPVLATSSQAYPRDKNAPFRQCTYILMKNGKRSPSAAPKLEKNDGVSFGAEHVHRNALAFHAQMKKTSSGPMGDTFLGQMSSYAKTELGSQSPESSHSEAG